MLPVKKVFYNTIDKSLIEFGLERKCENWRNKDKNDFEAYFNHKDGTFVAKESFR